MTRLRGKKRALQAGSLACAAASPAYRPLGKDGVVCGGAHYYSRRDRQLQMDYARTL